MPLTGRAPSAILLTSARPEGLFHMTPEHWFDTLNKVVVRDAPRRTLLGAVIAAIATLVHGAPIAEAGKNGGKKGKGQGKGKGKGGGKKNDRKKDKPKPPPDPVQNCSGGVCQTRWPSNSDYDTNNRNHCEFMCEQCKAPGNGPFCIIGGNVADCCDEGLTCCNGFCVNTNHDDQHCHECDNACSLARTCIGGKCECIAGFEECDGICRDTQRDENYCGGCDAPPCTGPGRQCCNGKCVDLRTDPDNCGQCGLSEPGHMCCRSLLWDEDDFQCCTHPTDPEVRWPCHSNNDCCIFTDSGMPGCCPRP
jgi:hypothetical protein